MGRWLPIVALVFAMGCGKESSGTTSKRAEAAPPAAQPAHPEMTAFLVEWFKAHGHSNVVTDANGVGIRGNPTRLQVALYGSERHKNGGFVVEVQFTTRVASGREITEFVAGTANTEDQAIKDALASFTMATFHVIYKAFINPADPHMTVDKIAFDGVDREVIAGDLVTRSAGKGADLAPMVTGIQSALKKFRLAPGPHWIKIVYSQLDGKPMTVEVTFDNAEHAAMTEAVKGLKWPKPKEFYMAKQFIVVK